MALASTAVSFAAAFAVSAPFFALTFVDFAPDIVFDDPLALAAVQLAVFVLATSRVPALGAASIAVAVWLVHGLTVRKIRVPRLGPRGAQGHKEGLRQTFAGSAPVTATATTVANPRDPRVTRGQLTVPMP